jgi:STE24 endopeptidase
MLCVSAAGSWIAFSLIALASRWWIDRLRLSGLSDIAGFPVLLLALSVIGLIGLPLQHAISRAFEWEADRFAVSVTRAPLVFANALRKLGELNLADPAPPRWVEWFFYDHPAITKRIRTAEGLTLTASSE